MKLEEFYEKNYKKILIIPYILLIIALVFLSINYVNTGEVIERDITLKGGTSITIYKEGINFKEIESYLKENFDDVSVRGLTDFYSRKNIGIMVEFSDTNEKVIKNALKEKIDFNEEDYSSETTGSKFGEGFYKGLMITILFAFLFMAIVVFVTFRTLVPSLAVISAALVDLIVTLAIISGLGFKLTSAGIVAFLLVIGYSIDTDILLTTRLLKRKEGSLYERLKSSIKTGLTMTVTTLVALSVGALFSTSFVLKQMFTIIVIALVIDIIATYLANAPILIWYCKKKNIY
ncbi:MAG: protein translocase subunit SecF [Nanoarchaeota archaeon]|nr:protein translocase subunit SecF [Nanoarchaeota archaeon]